MFLNPPFENPRNLFLDELVRGQGFYIEDFFVPARLSRVEKWLDFRPRDPPSSWSTSLPSLTVVLTSSLGWTKKSIGPPIYMNRFLIEWRRLHADHDEGWLTQRVELGPESRCYEAWSLEGQFSVRCRVLPIMERDYREGTLKRVGSVLGVYSIRDLNIMEMIGLAG